MKVFINSGLTTVMPILIRNTWPSDNPGETILSVTLHFWFGSSEFSIKDILQMFKQNKTITMEEMSDCEYSFLEALGRDKVKRIQPDSRYYSVQLR